MPKLKTQYVCAACGHETAKWMGRCPGCNRFNTFEEEVVERTANPSITQVKTRVQAQRLAEVKPLAEERIRTDLTELDRVLCGGIVQGSLVLVGGEPGVGKSTLLLQIAKSIGRGDKRCLYVSGEESKQQIKLRAQRLGVATEMLWLVAETDITAIEQIVREIEPAVVIIDSIQTMVRDELGSSPGSVTQVRECTSAFMRIAKGLGVSVIIVGHVTKDGAIAGPRLLEHMVDTVLYFEGERRESYRVIRTVKNRFGSTNEVGIFEMRDTGLTEIVNPSEYMLSGRPIGVSGSAVTCTIEGTRPIMTEVQALTGYTSLGNPRRSAAGMDYNRVIMLIAVLEKRLGMQLSNYDCYVNIAGGMRIQEPAVDAAVIAALASSFRNKIIDPHTIVFGEVGLAGELRAVGSSEKRIAEAVKLGFLQCVIPQANFKDIKKQGGIRILGASSVTELIEAIIQ